MASEYYESALELRQKQTKLYKDVIDLVQSLPKRSVIKAFVNGVSSCFLCEPLTLGEYFVVSAQEFLVVCPFKKSQVSLNSTKTTSPSSCTRFKPKNFGENHI